MDVWKVIGRYNNVVVLSKKHNVLILEINGKPPKVGESVRVWNNRILTGKELKAKLIAHFGEDLALKIFKTPGLLSFLNEISRGFEKSYVHFLKMLVKHLVVRRFLEMSDEDKKSLSSFFPKALEAKWTEFPKKFSFQIFIEFVKENFQSEKDSPVDVDVERMISMRRPDIHTEEHDVYQIDFPAMKKGIVGESYMIIPLQRKIILIVFKKRKLPKLSFHVKENPSFLFLEDFLKDKVTVEKRNSTWFLIWKGKEMLEFELPDKEILPKPNRLPMPNIPDAVFLLNNLLDENVKFLSLPSLGVSEMWWEKKENRIVVVVNTFKFGKVVADVLLDGRNLSIKFYAERHSEELQKHGEELQKNLERLGLNTQIFFSRKDPMIWEGFNAYG
ncbi:flagellar hook-length control protein FliK [Thermotoga sp. KOL6]|uniref:flagellar hook-length control protein FliK n=1 Tax=Thermotoga sp. KOL6 TaxID=126741 RepID=UPI000C76C4F6|nr:flagellar hook-length control protein FliK [Thermotoga sp. KOL6]PLV60335.1 hypothetical protein AS005_03380 [Thermotoga sp. KOL6]